MSNGTTERDPKVTARYRELGAEEPPRALDEAILAAAHRAVRTRPAPLVVPTGRRRWYFPLAAAAVLVLAVAVTVHVQREQPAEEIVTAARVPAPQPAQERKEPERPAPPAETAADQLAMRRSAPARDAVAPQAAPAPAAPPAVAEAGKREEARAFQGPAAAMSAARRMDDARASAAPSRFASHSPEQWLLAIEDLKRQGRHEDAARELAEFRKRYPDYRIPEAITERFETR